MTLRDKQFIIHIGPHRCGGTFLKRRIFPNIEGVYDVHHKDYDTISFILNAMEENPLFLDFSEIKKEIFQRFKNVGESIILITESDFFGSYFGMASAEFFYSKQFCDSKYNAAFLHSIFPGAKIFLTPRRQDKWIESYYRHNLRAFNTVTMKEFINPQFHKTLGQYSARSLKPCSDTKTLDWAVYVENYYRIFGKENVLVLPYEMMINEFEEFLRRMYEFMGVNPFDPGKVQTEKRSYSKFSCKLAFLLNRFVHTRKNPFGIIPDRPFVHFLMKNRDRSAIFGILLRISVRISLPWLLSNVIDKIHYTDPDLLGAAQRKEILNFYKAPNEKYAELIGMDLRKYGYY